MKTNKTHEYHMIEYVALDLPHTLVMPPQPVNIAEIQREVRLQSQGEPVEMDENMSVLTAALSFATMYGIAQEVVMKLNTGERVMLFDHHDETLLRPKDIDERVWNEIVTIREDRVAHGTELLPKPEAILNLKDIWDAGEDSADTVLQIVLFLKKLANNIKPAFTICLEGELPLPALLSAVYVGHFFAENVEYEHADGRIVLFSNEA